MLGRNLVKLCTFDEILLFSNSNDIYFLAEIVFHISYQRSSSRVVIILMFIEVSKPSIKNKRKIIYWRPIPDGAPFILIPTKSLFYFKALNELLTRLNPFRRWFLAMLRPSVISFHIFFIADTCKFKRVASRDIASTFSITCQILNVQAKLIMAMSVR